MKLRFFKDNYTNRNNFDFKNREELYVFIQKKAIKTFGLIIFVNLLKLFLFISISLMVDDSEELKVNCFLDTLLKIVDFVFIVFPIAFSIVCAYFIYFVKLKNNFETLLQSISFIKKTLNFYVLSILSAYLVIIYITMYLTIITSTNEPDLNNGFSFYFILIVTCLISTIFILFVMWIIYKLTYSIFLKKLNSYYYILKNTL